MPARPPAPNASSRCTGRAARRGEDADHDGDGAGRILGRDRESGQRAGADEQPAASPGRGAARRRSRTTRAAASAARTCPKLSAASGRVIVTEPRARRRRAVPRARLEPVREPPREQQHHSGRQDRRPEPEQPQRRAAVVGHRPVDVQRPVGRKHHDREAGRLVRVEVVAAPGLVAGLPLVLVDPRRAARERADEREARGLGAAELLVLDGSASARTARAMAATPSVEPVGGNPGPHAG